MGKIFEKSMYGRPCKGITAGILTETGEMKFEEVTGTFVALGMDYDGPASFTCAIIETADGILRNCRVDGFRFLDRTKGE